MKVGGRNKTLIDVTRIAIKRTDTAVLFQSSKWRS